MTFIRYLKIGKQRYAYNVTTYRDPETGKVKQRVKYLGKVVDANRKKFEKVLYKRHTEKAIVDFGDVHLVSTIYKRCGLEDVVRRTLGEYAGMVEVLVFNRIINALPMKSIYYWASNTYLSRTHNLSTLHSQNISCMLAELEDEETLRRFFAAYARVFGSKGGNLYDITSLPTSMSNGLVTWGYADSGIDFQTKLALLVDKDCRMPLWFRMLPGNLADVNSLTATVQEAEKLGFKPNMLVLDRGFFSNPNIKALCKLRTRFLIALPAKTKLYKRLVAKHQRLAEQPAKAFKFGKRVLFGTAEKVGSLRAYVILDPTKRARELNELYDKHLTKAMPQKKFDVQRKRKGFLILLSTEQLTPKEAVSLYYTRDFAEKCFRHLKSDLALLPLRRHNEATLAGYLLINFIALALYMQLKRVELRCSLKDALLILRGLKKKIYDDTEITTELTKEQKEILGAFKVSSCSV